MRLYKSLLPIAFVLLVTVIKAQEATPVVRLWDKNDHHFSNQIWSATCDNKGVVYFGNASGLLKFDSKEWDITPIRGKGIIRSTFYNDDRIYAGAFEEFGYYEKLSNGTLKYVSISEHLKEYKMNNDEIWNIFKYEDKIIFHSFVTLFSYSPHDETIDVINPDIFMESIGVDSQGRILSSAEGLSEIHLSDNTYTMIKHPWKGRMVAILPDKVKGDIIVTRDEGLYLWKNDIISKWKTDCDTLLINGSLNKAYKTSSGDIILGSSLFGCTAIDSTGHRIWSINADNVLNGNTILNICENREGDIFLALDSGIALIDNNSGIRYISHLNANVGAIYCVHYKEPYLYIGSNQGLYIGELYGTSLYNVQHDPSITGPVLYIEEYDGQILCGTNADTYCLHERESEKLSTDNAGGSCIAHGYINGQEVLIEGTYTKLCLYTKESGKWNYTHRIEGFIQPVNSIDIDFAGNIWVGHNRRGLYRLTLNDELSEVKTIKYYPSLGGKDDRIRVQRINGRTIFHDEDRLYTFDDISDSIVIYTQLNERVSSVKGIMDINLYKDNKYWVVNSDDAFLVDFNKENGIIQKVSYSIFNSNSVDLLKEIKPGPNGWSIMTLNNSLAFIKEKPQTQRWKSHLELSDVIVCRTDGSNYNHLDLTLKELRWDYSQKIVKITYSYPFFTEIENRHFEYKVKGRDQMWRKVDGEEIDLSHLEEGHYTIETRVVNNSDTVLDTISTNFYIKPPLWRSIWAYAIYTALGILAILYTYLSIKRRIQAQKRELENKKLEAELDAKSREIASTTMSLLNKNKILLDLKEELMMQKNEIGNAYPDKYYRKMISAIDSQISNEQDWQLFQQNFDRIHGNFFQILKTRYPSLTDSDLRFCSYLCMNLSSKEIASMMNISLKGVEAARYRIRKKIGLSSEISLTSFLMELK